MRTFIISCIVMLLAAPLWAEVDPSQVVGTWSRYEEAMGQQIVAILTILEDGSYTIVGIVGDQQIPIEAGTYAVVGTSFEITIAQSLRAPQDVGKTIAYLDAVVEGNQFTYKNDAGEVIAWVKGTDPSVPVTAVEVSSWGEVKARF